MEEIGRKKYIFQMRDGSVLINGIKERLFQRVQTSETTGPIFLAGIIGIFSGVTAVLLRRAVEMMQDLFQGDMGMAIQPIFGRYWPVPVIGLGGLIVGLMGRYLAKETKGHGIPEVMLAVAKHGGRIRARVAFVKIIAAAVTIGSGGSAGREGPIVHIGSALGSLLAQKLRLSDRMVILSVACGTAGGIAATFNAPMAGVMFALEIIVRRFTAHYFGMVVISSASATMMMRWLSGQGDYPKFPLLHNYSLTSGWDLMFFILLGVLCALAAHAFIIALHAVERISERGRIPSPLKPAMGGALVGLLAVYAPAIMGSGYESIEAALNNQMTGALLLILFAAKIIGTSLTVGSGGSGGVFVPTLFVGAMLGGAYGKMLNEWLPQLVSSAGAYSLVGMAVVFAAAAHAPITGILVLIEMTDNYYIIVPLMSATVMGTFISQRISKDSIYTVKLTQRGIHITDTPEVNLMDAVRVEEAMDPLDGVSPEMPVTELIEIMTQTHETGFPVVDKEDRLLGIVTLRDVENALLTRAPEALPVKDIATRNVVVCRPEQTLSAALSQFGAHGYGRLPVMDPHHPEKAIGVLKRRNIISACVEARLKSQDMLARAEEYQAIRRGAGMLIVSSVVTAGSPLSGRYVRDAAFPAEATLGAIRRGIATVVPRGSTQILPGDELVLLTTQENSHEIMHWLKERT